MNQIGAFDFMIKDVPPHIWLRTNLVNMLRWMNVVEKYHDVGMITKEGMFDQNSTIYKAMEFTGFDMVDFSLVHKIHAISDNWLNKDEPLKPLDDYALLDVVSDSAEAAKAIESYCREQPNVDREGFNMPLIIAALGNAASLNQAFTKIKEAKLDANVDFKETLKTILAIRAVHISLKDEKGGNDTGGVSFELMKPYLIKIINLMYSNTSDTSEKPIRKIPDTAPPQ